MLNLTDTIATFQKVKPGYGNIRLTKELLAGQAPGAWAQEHLGPEGWEVLTVVSMAAVDFYRVRIYDEALLDKPIMTWARLNDAWDSAMTIKLLKNRYYQGMGSSLYYSHYLGKLDE